MPRALTALLASLALVLVLTAGATPAAQAAPDANEYSLDVPGNNDVPASERSGGGDGSDGIPAALIAALIAASAALVAAIALSRMRRTHQTPSTDRDESP